MPTLTTNYSFNKPLVNSATDADLWGGQLNTNWDSADTIIKGVSDSTSPAGAVIDFSGTTAPTGWLLCYGQAVSRATYATLFAVTSTTYGIGDGSTTFNLPDLRGRVVAGQDDMGGVSADRLTNQSGGVDGDVLGDSGGDETHLNTAAESGLPSHTHSLGFGDGVNVAPYARSGSSTNNQGNLTTESAGGSAASTAHNNVQPVLILNKIIKT